MADVALEASFDTNKRNYNAVQKLMHNKCAELKPKQMSVKNFIIVTIIIIRLIDRIERARLRAFSSDTGIL